MKRSQRLKVIVGLNSENEKKALQALGAVQTKKQSLQLQLQNLQDYLQEYKDKYLAFSQGGARVGQLIEYRAFITKLEKAIEEQQQAVLAVDEEVLEARKHWERQHQKTSSLQKVCDSALAEEIKIENKKEQNEQDERAGRLGRGSGTRNA